MVRNYELRKTTIRLAAFMAVTGSLVCSALAQTNSQRSRQAEPTEAKGFSDSDKAALSRQISSAVSRGDVPGVVALITGREGVLFEGAAGKVDVAHDIAMPVTALFSIASMTKPVTSVAIMMLFEQGKLVRAYWTNFAKFGDPNGPGLPRWVPWDTDQEPFMTFSNAGDAVPQQHFAPIYCHLSPDRLKDKL